MEKVRENKSLEEIKDPVRRSKLAGIQEVVFDLDEKLVEERKQLAANRQDAQAMARIATVMLEECARIGTELKNGIYSKAEAQVRMDQTKVLIAVLEKEKNERAEAARSIAARIEGYELAVNMAAQRFESENRKAERYQRMQAEDAAEKMRREQDAEAARTGMAVMDGDNGAQATEG